MIEQLAPILQGTILIWLLCIVAARYRVSFAFTVLEISWCRLEIPRQASDVKASTDQTGAGSMYSFLSCPCCAAVEIQGYQQATLVSVAGMTAH